MTSLLKFEIRNRWTGNVQFTAEIEADENTPSSIKVGLAVKWARGSDADLRRADLSDADLRRADLRDADLRRADLRRADLSGADLSGADVPFIPALDSKILAAIETGGSLEMGSWHRCETTHCRAGWAITLAGEAGKKLENQFGPAGAGALIYARAYPDLRIPDFYDSNERALEDIRSRAASDPVEAA